MISFQPEAPTQLPADIGVSLLPSPPMSLWSSACRDFRMQGQARGYSGCKAAENNTQFSTADRCSLSDLNLKPLRHFSIQRGLTHSIITVLPFFFFFMCVCARTFHLSSPTPISPSTSHQCTLQTSSGTFISCQKGSDLVTGPAPQAASAMLFLPLRSSPGRA